MGCITIDTFSNYYKNIIEGVGDVNSTTCL